MNKDLHHPVTNGETKKMVWLSLIFLFILSVLCIIGLLISGFLFSGLSMIVFKSVLGTGLATNSGGIVYAVHSFFDNRTKAQKYSDKRKLKKDKYEHKERMYALKNKNKD